MRYVEAKFKEAKEAEAYRIYVTDAFKLIGGLNLRYVEMINPVVEETRTADEIIQSISEKLSKAGGK